MRLAAIRFEQFFQLIEGAAGETDHLFTVIQHLHVVEAQGADNDDIAVIVVAAGG
ncbi:hypothetical protein D3C80_2040800 [compost metagenome]